MAAYDIVFKPYYSLDSYSMHENLDELEARQYMAKLLKDVRKLNYPIIVLESGIKYEVEQPYDGYLVDDSCGILQIVLKEESEITTDDYTGVLEDYELFNS